LARSWLVALGRQFFRAASCHLAVPTDVHFSMNRLRRKGFTRHTSTAAFASSRLVQRRRGAGLSKCHLEPPISGRQSRDAKVAPRKLDPPDPHLGAPAKRIGVWGSDLPTGSPLGETLEAV
jgi:hypothetical protein